MTDSDGPPIDAIEESRRMFDHSQIPKTELLRQLAIDSAELIRTDRLIQQTEELLETLRAKRHKIVSKSLPDMFDRCLTDKIGLPEESADVVLESIYHAAIKHEWPDEQREAGFAELERVGAGDLVKCVLSVSFGKREMAKCRAVAAYLQAWNAFENRPISIRQDVAWNTLTAFVKTEIQDGNKQRIDLEKIGARVGREARIKWRAKR